MERRHALLVECDPGQTLGGSCTRDVENMAAQLIANGLMLKHNIHLLTTRVDRPRLSILQDIPRDDSANLFNVFDTIMERRPEFVLVLITGHGYSIADTSGDETDSRDEAIAVSARMVTDDEIYSRIVCRLDCRAILLADTCHSGTMFDLPWTWNGQWIHSTRRQDAIISSAIFAVSFSACHDSQLSMCDIGDKTGFGGSLTIAILNLDGLLNDLIANCESQSGRNWVAIRARIQERLALLGQTVILSATQKIE